ncbi:MAG TPA: hypothetical protein VF477_10665 [Mycobacterium sp.]
MKATAGALNAITVKIKLTTPMLPPSRGFAGVGIAVRESSGDTIVVLQLSVVRRGFGW